MAPNIWTCRRLQGGINTHGCTHVNAALPPAALPEEWADVDAHSACPTRTVRLVQWYPGHIAKAERKLKEQLRLMDVIIEVRDARIPIATCHPELESWIGDKKKVLVLNREDMISTADKNGWAAYFAQRGQNAIFTDGRRGAGSMKLARASKSVVDEINAGRRKRGLLPRAVRAAVIGYPNVGKSSIINRLLRRKICETAPRPGVTRDLKWARIGEDLDLLDAPGVLPMKIVDQTTATKLAICNDIGGAAYAVAGVAAGLIDMMKCLPIAGRDILEQRYSVSVGGMSGEEYLEQLSPMFNGDVDQASHRVLHDFRSGKFGRLALERPPAFQSKGAGSERGQELVDALRLL
eukprot:TRINITY_DN13301_c0_g1_i2.p1 TRINITY_DN13301_c0_g1~~TRINITY_DN13301_c0_g1_i2.p1  ORF type:complete len:350 (-),score=58.54 TRINITY_DN13301_c0_g1_i2:220-1269(-)